MFKQWYHQLIGVRARLIPVPVPVSISNSTRTRARVRWIAFTLALMLLPTTTFAQTGGTGIAKFQDAAKKITQAIQQISGVAVLLLLVAGFGLMMWGGISEGFRLKAVRICSYCIIGSACLFLFAQPLADFITSTFGTGTTG